MAIQVTIVGMGQIGTSVGLALTKHKERFTRVGHDRELRSARLAEKMGALDRVALNLPNAARDADLVILALPLDQIQEALQAIVSELRPGALVMDTAPLKDVVAGWAQRILPENRHYIGLTPVLNPAYLHSPDTGVESARADLFHDGMMAVITPLRVPSEAISLATDFVHLLGAEHLFVDPLELDSLMAATHLLPQLLSAALVDATVNRPGWREARKLAGRAFAQATSPISHQDEPGALAASATLAHEATGRVLDNLIASLQDLRQEIAAGEAAALENHFQQARFGRDLWWQQRKAANWVAEETSSPVESPTSAEVFGRMIGLGRKKPKK